MFNPKAYENTRPDGVAVLEVVNDGTGPRQFVPLRRTTVSGEIAGPLATLQVTHLYGYTREECARVLEAVYRFPLPGDAAVTGVRVTFGEVEIRAELKEREQAETEYQEAKARGQQTALATRESPDVFTLRVAGLQPDQEVRVETSYVQLARTEGGNWTLRIPLTTAPRYVRPDEVGSRSAQGQPLRVLRDPGHRFSLDLQVQATAAVSSSTHRLVTTPEAGALRVALAGEEVIPDRDCVLSWRPAREADRPSLQVLLHAEPEGEHFYFLALAAPPARVAEVDKVPREVVLLVDHSGSMQGSKWKAADQAVTEFLRGLKEQDHYGLCLFHNEPFWLKKDLQQADSGGIAAGIKFLTTRKDSGGTNLGVALEQGLRFERKAGEASRHLLVVTDTEVTDFSRIMRLAQEERKRREARRISVLCVDAAPNAFLAHELAERGGGVARFLTSDPAEEDITASLTAILADWDAPVFTNLRLEVNRPEVGGIGQNGTPGTEEGWSSLDLGDLPAGRAVWIAGRVPRGTAPDLSFRLVSGAKKLAAWRSPLTEALATRPGIKALFGARRVLALEYLSGACLSPEKLSEQLFRLGITLEAEDEAALYAENRHQTTAKALKKLLVRESLEYGIASAETAFIAVHTAEGERVQETVPVANALPAGWSEGFAAPRGAMFRKAYFAPAPASPPPPPSGVAYAAYDAIDSAPEERERGISLPNDLEVVADLDVPVFLRRRPVPILIAWSAPSFINGECVLYDTTQDARQLPDDCRIESLEFAFSDEIPDLSAIDSSLCLLIYVGDMSTPHTRVTVQELIDTLDEYPLSFRRRGEPIRIVLQDPSGIWAAHPPKIRVRLNWQK